MKNIVMLMILVICTPSYLSNPYLTAKLIEVRIFVWLCIVCIFVWLCLAMIPGRSLILSF